MSCLHMSSTFPRNVSCEFASVIRTEVSDRISTSSAAMSGHSTLHCVAVTSSGESAQTGGGAFNCSARYSAHFPVGSPVRRLNTVHGCYGATAAIGMRSYRTECVAAVHP